MRVLKKSSITKRIALNKIVFITVALLLLFDFRLRADEMKISLQDKVAQSASDKKTNVTMQNSISGEEKPRERPIIFLGASLTRGGKWSIFFPGEHILNYGVNGRTMRGALRNVKRAVKANPRKIFIMFGAADFIEYRRKPRTLSNYEKLISILRAELPDAEIYVQSVLPIYVFSSKTSEVNNKIALFNLGLKRLAAEQGIVYIDLFPIFNDPKKQALLYVSDGIHLTKEGYSLWAEKLEPYIYTDSKGKSQHNARLISV